MADVQFTTTFGAGGSNSPLGPFNVTSDGTLGLVLYREATGTNQPYTVAIDVSQITSLFMVCDTDCTVKVDDTGSPTPTLAFKAGIPLVWVLGMPNACPLSVDVTVLYLTPAAGTTIFRGLVNQNIVA